MDRASLPDLNSLDHEALLALYQAQQEQQKKLDAILATREEELRNLEAELQPHRQTLSEQADELRSGSERIEHHEAHG
jgi:Skp family chaperone for outer membrane proteins